MEKQKSSKKLSNKGFTLIELLVVVLIIGILAAIALPQYRLAVDKTKMTQLITFAQAVRQAQERYYLVNNSYANNWKDIDISLDGASISGSDLSINNAYAVLNSGNNGLYLYSSSDYLPGILLISFNEVNYRLCYANETNERAQALCKHVCNKKTLYTDGVWKGCSF